MKLRCPQILPRGYGLGCAPYILIGHLVYNTNTFNLFKKTLFF